MNDISKEIMDLIQRYGSDTRQALQEHSRLEYLYALSDMRENLLEWYPFRPDASLLQVGSDYGALTGLYSRKVRQVVVLDSSEDNLEVNRMRNKQADNVSYVNGGLLEAARHRLVASAEDGTGTAGGSGEAEMLFDYVMMIGSLKPDYQAQIQAAKSLLKPGGELILAVCNRFGMKYWAGANRDEHHFSKREITRLVTGEDVEDDGESKSLEFYYPMPDYRLPITIYSQSYLPGKGDLTNTLTAYDYPKYLLLDIGASYDAVCEDGQFENFANSFLMIWRSHGSN